MIGLIATVLTVFSIIPQLVKSYKTKTTGDISLKQQLILFVGLIFWLLYGFQINDTIVILANALSIMFSAILIGMKIKYDGLFNIKIVGI